MGMVLFVGYEKRIVDLSIKHRLPSIFEGSAWVNVGGLMSYAAYTGAAWRRAAVYVDKILKGAKPADLPENCETDRPDDSAQRVGESG